MKGKIIVAAPAGQGLEERPLRVGAYEADPKVTVLVFMIPMGERRFFGFHDPYRITGHGSANNTLGSILGLAVSCKVEPVIGGKGVDQFPRGGMAKEATDYVFLLRTEPAVRLIGWLGHPTKGFEWIR